MEEKEQFISNLKRQMQELEDEHKTKLESCEREIDKLKWNIEELENRSDEFKKYVALRLKEHEIEWKWICNLVKSLPKESQDSEEEREILHDQVEMLSAETFADKQKDFNGQFCTLTGDISSEPDNVPRKKIELSRSLSFDSESDNESYVPLEEERKSLRSSSIDDGYGSDKENCGNNLPSSIGSDISIEKVAKSRNVGKALL